ncbi:gluconate 2-dehydrogenase subunit 3 family protein [Marinobacter alexandrii]|jgi:hypothetical protein|uniref:gluconate 2-dehydrogenase subunit 3 family protein n=1 Tax=Marinobacter alexandrii TaxID=2570351 RepID=UPI001FFE54BE|nr:gluconate 2-dehydrogenase subunit 3 family protein [Marinobacter alexandrii]MCK2150606.1 gluconate 2-dehydrogenase subunit 3 family protein [Marinobacter alexandrii]
MNNDNKRVKHPKDESHRISRRGFIAGSGATLVGGAAILSSAGLFAADSKAAQKIGEESNRTLLRMARDVFPHDDLEDKYYQQVMVPLAKRAETDPKLMELLTVGVAALDQESNARYGTTYLNVETEEERVVVLKAIESSVFFQKIKGDLMMGIYNNPEIWEKFGFGGSSWEHGGYINRGFDDIDWV